MCNFVQALVKRYWWRANKRIQYSKFQVMVQVASGTEPWSFQSIWDLRNGRKGPANWSDLYVSHLVQRGALYEQNENIGNPRRDPFKYSNCYFFILFILIWVRLYIYFFHAIKLYCIDVFDYKMILVMLSSMPLKMETMGTSHSR